jgi:Flp pilus assembly protein TadD
MAEAEQLGQRANQLEHVLSGGGGATGAMPPEKAAAAASSSASSDGIDQKKAAINNAISEMRSHQMRDWSDAEKLYNQALDGAPSDAMLHAKHARALGDLGKANLQTAELRAACSLEPKNAAFAAELGDAFYDHENWDGAEAQYKEALRLQPDSALYHFDLGGVYLERKNWSAAESEAKQATALEPGNEMYHRLYENAQKRQNKKTQ